MKTNTHLPKEYSDFSSAQLGDRVWSSRKGPGKITGLAHTSTDGFDRPGNRKLYIISVTFDNNLTNHYDSKGRYLKDDLYSELFHEEPEFSTPPPPKRKHSTKYKGWIEIIPSTTEGCYHTSNIFLDKERFVKRHLCTEQDQNVQQIEFIIEE